VYGKSIDRRLSSAQAPTSWFEEPASHSTLVEHETWLLDDETTSPFCERAVPYPDTPLSRKRQFYDASINGEAELIRFVQSIQLAEN
jgi:hypothetical protein